LQGFGPAVGERIEAYRAALDPRFGTVYARRRLFEESVTRIADTISSYLDLEEQTAQGMFPHYFEKQKTDGVDYQIYVGASLVEDGRFDPLYLKSLRLWQLMVTCGIALRTHQLRDQLPVPLEATHLVLVQHAPLSIRFRFDEKRFDVDGAYDIRYGIVKKRVDKALNKAAGERVVRDRLERRETAQADLPVVLRIAPREEVTNDPVTRAPEALGQERAGQPVAGGHAPEIERERVGEEADVLVLVR